MANSISLALNYSRESTMKFGRSGVGREVPPLRSGNQYGFNSVLAHHVNRANQAQDDNAEIVNAHYSSE